MMTGKMTPEQRRKMMGSIRAKSKLENRIAAKLWRKGLRFRRNVRSLYGTPDFAIKKYRVVIFIDSCFWHYCPIHGRLPKNNQEFWKQKLQRNIDHDEEVSLHYEESGWNILRVWEHEFREDFDGAVEKIALFILGAKQQLKKK